MAQIESSTPEHTAPQISIIIPAFNEQESIVACVQEIHSVFADAGYAFEILIVNDGSTDNTLEVSAKLKSHCPFVRVIDLGRNYGKNVALSEGTKRAKGDIIAFFDADLQYDAQDLVRMIKVFDGSPKVVSGRRDYRTYETVRTSISKTYNGLLKVILRMPISDSNCGIKAMSKVIAESAKTFSFGSPLMVPYLKVRGHKIEELPVRLRQRHAGTSKHYDANAFFGGWKTFRSISYHSIMLLGLMLNIPLESRMYR